jgi:hypothetical protein
MLNYLPCSMADQSDYNTSDEEVEQDSSLDTDQMHFLGGTQDSTSNDNEPKLKNRDFACLHPVPSEYPNKELVEIFHRMQHFRELDGAYRPYIICSFPTHGSKSNVSTQQETYSTPKLTELPWWL